ncbi:uncharacterized protein LOC112569797 [Pomacea canaliculata]|uniref:uncharacterized protein LOC112569797 n=1 Tax=Pomacea canaliculata TaxID=400727 RepID=UPI000D7332A3|nr:uncharacterized protein LOC112569797 [Pomacea canaliculata]
MVNALPSSIAGAPVLWPKRDMTALDVTTCQPPVPALIVTTATPKSMPRAHNFRSSRISVLRLGFSTIHEDPASSQLPTQGKSEITTQSLSHPSGYGEDFSWLHLVRARVQASFPSALLPSGPGLQVPAAENGDALATCQGKGVRGRMALGVSAPYRLLTPGTTCIRLKQVPG